MRALQGKQVVELAADWRDRLAGWRQVILDLGTGDGRFPYALARSDPDSFYIGVDPDPVALATYAYRASRKPSRGGASNVLYVVASVAQLPPELTAVADVVHVVFPWAGLLRGLLVPEAATLDTLARLGKPDARWQLVLSFDPRRDTGVSGAADLPALDERVIDDVLAPAYAKQGLVIESRRRLSRDEGLAIPSTWGRRLLHARPRDIFTLTCRRADRG